MSVEEKICGVCNRVYRTEQDFLTGTKRWRVCSLGNLWFNCGCGSTLMVKKGKYPWYSPELAIPEDARGVFNRLGNLKDLPHIPVEVMAIQQLLQKPDVDPKTVALELRKEPVLATQTMRIAENLRMARNPTTPRMKQLEHAVVYIGFKALSDLLLTSSVRALPLPKSGFNADAFWEESYLTGTIAEIVMQRHAQQSDADEVFLAASLCNIGKLVTAFCFPPLATKISHDVEKPPLVTWRQAETSYSFPDHSILGEIASALWGFPETTLNATRRHHDLLPTQPRGRPLQVHELAAVANQLTHWVLLRPHRIEEPILKSFQERTGLDDKGLDAFALELGEVRKRLAEPVRTP